MHSPFRQVDVFGSEPFRGNPVAVLLDAEGLTQAEMQQLANWTNLSETTFVQPPDADGADYADYKVRIFTPVSELPFAGHPTLGTCHAWLEAGGKPRQHDVIVQQCGAGLIEVRRTPDGLGFAAPPVLRSGPVDAELLGRIAAQLGLDVSQIVEAQWADNGPGWVAVLLGSADAVLALRPGTVDMDIGVAGPYPDGSPCSWEVRAFFPKDGSTVEDPVTGSFNASLAQWLIGAGRARAPYVVSQGTALGRSGRVYISRDGNGDPGRIWVAGATVTRVHGVIEL